VKICLSLSVTSALAALAILPSCGDGNRPATWAYISPVILQPNCATSSCHDPSAAVDGLDFSTPDTGYTSLTGLWTWLVDPAKDGQPGCGHAAGTVVCEEQFRPLVTPYDPSESRLINVLRGRDAPRMPADRPLDEADIRLIEKWILDGAKKNSSEPPDGGPADAQSDVGDAAAEGGDAAASDGDAAGPSDGGAGAAPDAADGAGDAASG
jgi:hypothetical protein